MTTPAELLALGDEALTSLKVSMSRVEPDKCVLEVLGALSILTLDVLPWRTAPGYGKRRDQALNISSRWLSSRRTAKQIKKIFSMTCTCSEDITNWEIHDLGFGMMNDTTDTPAQMLLSACTVPLGHLFGEVKGHPKLKLHLLASRNTWPYNTEQLLPHGPEETICGYLDWLTSKNALYIVRFLECITTTIDHTWPITAPVIIKKGLIIEQFVDTTLRWSNVWSCYARGERSGPQHLHPMRISGIMMQLLTIVRMMCSEYADTTAADHFLRPRWDDILLSCDRILTTTKSLSTHFQTHETTTLHDLAVKHAVVLVHVLYCAIPESRSQCSRMSSRELTQAVLATPIKLPQFLPWSTLMSVLHYQYTIQTCAAPNCTRTSEQHGRPFRSCTGCHWVQYCSRKCQKNSWRRDDGLQHRDVCSLIRFLCSCQLPIPRPHDEFHAAIKITPDYVSEKELVVVRAINRHFSALTWHAIAS
jgi:hypothetical protein